MRRHSIPRGLYRRGRTWWVCYTVQKGRPPVRKSTGKTSMKDAEDMLDNIKHEINVGTYIPERDRKRTIPHPFEVVCESYLRDRDLRGKRDDSYRKLVADWLPVFNGRDITSIDLADVEGQLATWKAGRGWSDATYNNSLSQLSGVFTYAYRQGWIERHPLRGRAERLAVSNGERRYFYPHELAAMVRTARALARLHGQSVDWLANIVMAAPFTGLRRSAFCSLRVRDARKDEAGEIWLRVDRDKNGEPVEKRLVGRVAEIVQDRIDSALPMAYLFPGPWDGRRSRRTNELRQATAYHVVDDYLRVVVERVGKRHPDWGLRWGVRGGVTFHSFRHAMASLALNAGVPRDVVKKMGNWKTDAMVNRYAHRADEHVRAAEDRLAEVLNFTLLHSDVKRPNLRGRNARKLG